VDNVAEGPRGPAKEGTGSASEQRSIGEMGKEAEGYGDQARSVASADAGVGGRGEAGVSREACLAVGDRAGQE
jgi:hypothetical protein